MNSFYGVMGSYGCSFIIRSSKCYTSTGNGASWQQGLLEKKGYKVLYGDTDSLFVKIKDDEAIDL